jgi:tRNA1Val (adenine37-N6)-methyltransferase
MMLELRPHERLDDLVFDGLKVIQRDDEFCFSLDTVLLAHFGTAPRGPVLDMGTGTGAIPLILTGRGVTDITAVELNPVMADIAQRNVTLNGRDKWIRIVETDYRAIRSWARSGQFDAIYVNPPYREPGKGRESLVDGIRRARHEETATLEDVLSSASYGLRYHGRFRMVHIAERLTDVMSAMRSFDIEPKCLQLVHGRPEKKAKLILIEGVRGGHSGLEVLPPLIVHEADGSYSRAVLDIYGKP